ncbi:MULTISPECIES: ABC transporter permease [unclassified Coleofasciculus]|uniref:ABC transporter permease n=1 Tax=unclassified Coleofasciculus TaxID=2692782 RepID=UPI00187EC50E|nr:MULTISPECIES: ABC transporter permease [unclassified Coleofasciculus]MBE9127583.1 ABC transporter permease [Coleofasciculus sp. LEGE 07081]MBE9149786.1 ABC transporter permease [Coleofasciculus sp. LEGE 07092]
MVAKRTVSVPLPKWRLPYLYDLLRELVSRDMKLLYKRSALGVAWTLINPLLQLAVFAFVFQLVLPVSISHYASFVFTGLLVWNWFQNSLFQATGVIIANRSLIRQPGFPNAILPVVITTTGLIHFLLALPVLIVFLLIDGIALKPVILFLPILQALQFAFTVSLAYVLAALNVTFRDTQHTLGVLLQLFFYLTPIFYDLQNVPTGYQSLYFLNPMVHIVTAYRDVLIQGTQPNWLALLIIGLMMAVLLPVGHYYFQRQSDRFVEEL